MHNNKVCVLCIRHKHSQINSALSKQDLMYLCDAFYQASHHRTLTKQMFSRVLNQPVCPSMCNTSYFVSQTPPTVFLQMC